MEGQRQSENVKEGKTDSQENKDRQRIYILRDTENERGIQRGGEND